MVSVSIVMTVFNRERFLPLAIESFIKQSFSGEMELLIWDDGSTDHSAAIARSFAQKDPRIKLVQADHLGRSLALVKAVAASSGQYIGLLDSDDLLLPTAIADSIALLEDGSAVGMVYSQFLHIDQRGQLRGLGQRSHTPYSPARLLVDFMTFHFRLFRRSLYDQVGGFDPFFEWAEDYDLCLKFSEVTTIRHLPKPLYCYRSHGDNLTLNQVELLRFSAIAIQHALQRRGLDQTYHLELTLESSFNIVPMARAARERVMVSEGKIEEEGEPRDTGEINEEPLVSIIIPCFNAAGRIEQCLKSCLNQSYKNIEIIVVDNNSTDESVVQVKRGGKGAHCPVMLLDCPQQGANLARNMGFECAKGDYIQWLDADDVLDPEKIERQVAILEADTKVDIAYGDWQWGIVKDGALLTQVTVKEQQYDDIGLLLLLDHWRPPHSYLLRRAIALKLHQAKAWHPDTKCAMDREYFSLAAFFGARFVYGPGMIGTYVHWSRQQITQVTSPIKRMETLQKIFGRLQKVAIEGAGEQSKIRAQHWLLLKQCWALWRPSFSVVLENDEVVMAHWDGRRMMAKGPLVVVAGAIAPLNKGMTLEAIALFTVKRLIAISALIFNTNDLKTIHESLDTLLNEGEKAETIRKRVMQLVVDEDKGTSLGGPMALPLFPQLRFKVWAILNRLQHDGWLKISMPKSLLRSTPPSDLKEQSHYG